MTGINLTTIGFTKTTAAGFFGRVKSAGVKKVIDVRLHNTSQLAGFAKADDLAYFLKEICGTQYVHQPLLAPTDDILKAFKRDKGDWNIYENSFIRLMQVTAHLVGCEGLRQEVRSDSSVACRFFPVSG